jgi:hypothetical protein
MAKAPETRQVTTPKKLDLEAMRLKAREKVSGIFRFYEVPGGSLRFSFLQFKGDKVENYHLIDGQTYTIPLGVAVHLNNNGWYPSYDYVKIEQPLRAGQIPEESIAARISKKIHRYGFQSLQFMDIEGMQTPSSEVIVAEKI